MKRTNSIIIAAAALSAALCLAACNKYDFTGAVWGSSAPVDTRFMQSQQYNEQQGLQTVYADSNNYRVYAFGDCHLDGSTRNLDRFVADYLADSQAAPFALCVGDLIYDTGHYDLFYDHTKMLLPGNERRLFICAGNHDIFFGQWEEFRKRYGTSTYCFEVVTPSAGKDLYIALDSASATLGSRQFKWLEQLLESKRSGYRNVIVFTHTNYYMRDYSQGIGGNYNMEETMEHTALFARYNVNLVICGHDHFKEQTMFKGVMYNTLDALNDTMPQASYAVFTIGDSSTGVVYVNMNR